MHEIIIFKKKAQKLRTEVACEGGIQNRRCKNAKERLERTTQRGLGKMSISCLPLFFVASICSLSSVHGIRNVAMC